VKYDLPSVKDYMKKDFASISSEASALEASKTMVKENMGYIIVLEKGKPVGIMTEKDLIKKVMAADKDPKKVEASQVMSSPLVTVDPDDDVSKAIEVMKKHAFRRLPVVKSGIIYGVFTAKELVDHFEEFEDLQWRDIVRFFPFR
jgi:CBS domain-containing protein